MEATAAQLDNFKSNGANGILEAQGPSGSTHSVSKGEVSVLTVMDGPGKERLVVSASGSRLALAD